MYLFSVAAGVPPAVEPGILPGGLSCGLRRRFRVQRCHSGRQAAVLYGSQDGCRYSRKPTLNTYRFAIEVRASLSRRAAELKRGHPGPREVVLPSRTSRTWLSALRFQVDSVCVIQDVRLVKASP